MLLQERDTGYVTPEMLTSYIAQAAQSAGYTKGFGITDCDLSLPIWWAGYCRQSLDQQSHNNRLPEYLLTLAKMARDQGVVVPREYILYDHVSGEHLTRPGMEFLRHDLMDKKRILGILFADLRCLSREPAPQQVFERECEIRGVRLIFGDAPSGMDIGSQFARSAITFSNKLTRLATNRNARAGNIGRVLKGWVPSHKAAYGYVYRREAEITEGRIQIKKAWWELDSLDTDGKPVLGSPADAVVKIFHWLGNEGRTGYWVAKKLNELGISGPSGIPWSRANLNRVIISHCYTGKHTYNAKGRVPNPNKPLGDVTGIVKRTLIRPKPAGEAVEYSVPALVSEDLWQRANQALKARGRGRGKEGKTIQALLRGHIFCPRCGRPMVVRRRKSTDPKIYYHCSKAENFSGDGCMFRTFVPGAWDEVVWDSIYALLEQDTWIEEQLGETEKQSDDIRKLIMLEQQKFKQCETKVAKIREGFEGGIYSLEETKAKIATHQQASIKATKEIQRLEALNGSNQAIDVAELRRELQVLRKQHLDQATFTEKTELIHKLNIKVYPSEDLKTMKIKCSLLPTTNEGSLIPGDQNGCRIITLGSASSP